MLTLIFCLASFASAFGVIAFLQPNMKKAAKFVAAPLYTAVCAAASYGAVIGWCVEVRGADGLEVIENPHPIYFAATAMVFAAAMLLAALLGRAIAYTRAHG